MTGGISVLLLLMVQCGRLCLVGVDCALEMRSTVSKMAKSHGCMVIDYDIFVAQSKNAWLF
ncbi:hypothetical protein [Nitratidesulfovibrio liaohensis]|uniref:Uncharacterized protein n=1 Tax=Nitratidesulfovibrio liaohensis TaxID=2604158 RepID=A0ABY9R564_9BACT|nr:hypothetical protein [Nitratidesulfovibrio liaohensis]WMW66876.1 hypothetical protein KPS_001502 [Nitratidesulfovibrio liaohensis]